MLKNKVVVRCQGGIGNQMFQYALYLSLQNKRRCVFLDTEEYKDASNREFQLIKAFKLEIKQFQYPVIISSISNILDICMRANGLSRLFNILNKILDVFLRKGKRLYWSTYKNIHDRQPIDIASVENIRRLYLNGYWQSSRYFRSAESRLRNAFVFSMPNDRQIETILKTINKSESISIHVRRGDYENNPRFNKIYGGICTVNYYRKAIEYFRQRFHDARFFIFSDDIEWVSTSGLLDGMKQCERVHFQGSPNWTDMFLMSKCKHNIIANSSYSWWAAWLNDNPDKAVIAPRKWVNEGWAESLSDLSGIYESDWIVM